MSQIKCSYCEYVFSETEYIFRLYSADDCEEIRICNNCLDEITVEVLKEEEENAETLKIT